MKKLLSLFLALTMLLSLAACAEDGPSPTETTKPEASDYPILCEFEIKGISCSLTIEEKRQASLSLSQTMTEENLETIGVDVEDATVVRTTTASGTYKKRRGVYTLTLKKLTLSMEITGDDAEEARDGMLNWYTSHPDADSEHILDAINGKEVDVSPQLDSSYFKIDFELDENELESMTVYEEDGETVALTFTFHSNGRVKKESHYRDGKVYKSYEYNRWGKLTAQDATAPAPAKKTVYFCTAQASLTQALHTTTETAYDEAGRLIGCRISRNYPDMDTVSDISLSYEYSDQGTIKQIILSSVGESIPMAARYEEGLLVGYYGEYDGKTSGWRFAYNEDGRITTVYLIENEYEKEVISLSYDVSGALRERVIHDSVYQMVTKYNEAGKSIEQYVYAPETGTFLYRNVYEYDAQGNQVRQESYTRGSSEPDSVTQMKYDAQGRCVWIEASGNGQSAQATGIWDAATATMSFTLEIEDIGTASVQQTYDDIGHVISNTTMTGDTVIQQNTYTYTALELPIDYEMPDLQDPIYLLFAFGIT